MSRKDAFDYVVVGAGSAGCVLANRLSADPGVRVLLLEAGGRDWNPLIHLPIGETHLIGGRHDWRFESEPEPALGGRRFALPRGKVLGGSSSINGQIYARGHPLDYDAWADLGNAGWSWADVLPYFKRAEKWKGGADGIRGGDGPLETAFGRYENPLYDAFLEAGRALGFAVSDDYNGAAPEGFCRTQFTHTHRSVRRCSSARAYLVPARARPNLTVSTRSLATRVLFDGRRAAGVEYVRRGRHARARAEREVILAAGAYQSPQLLLLSGVGDADELGRLGIATVAHVPGVGRELQDHFGSSIEHACTRPITYYRYVNPFHRAAAFLRYLAFRDGPLAVFPINVQAFLKSAPSLARPDIKLSFFPAAAAPEGARGVMPRAHGYRITWQVLRPESRGRVALRSADPAAAPRIFCNYLSAEGDRALNRRAFRLVRQIHAQAPLQPFRGPETAPGAACTSDADIDAYMERVSFPHYHPVGTCRMGNDAGAVVDSRLRVRGLERLRVADASIMPRLVSANTNAPAIMIGEKAADLILADAKTAGSRAGA